MKKSESTSRKETPEEELKRLRKENQSLKSDLKKVDKQHERIKDKFKQTKGKLKQIGCPVNGSKFSLLF